MAVTLLKDQPWQDALRSAVHAFVEQAVPKNAIGVGHVTKTPDRVVRAFSEYVSGYQSDPASFLKVFANGDYDQMIHVRRIQVLSLCAHHLLPIVGVAHFAYIPHKKIVGLSKIPRMVNALARRLQVQEDLTQQIVGTFQNAVRPAGCGAHIRAVHFCMLYRGVEEPFSLTETTALRGAFRNGDTKQEFLDSIERNGSIFV